MRPQRFALVGGIIMLALGVLALIPAFSTYPPELPLLKIMTSYGMFAGFIAMNIVNKVALIGFGIWGIVASRAPTTSLPASINYSRWVFGVMGVLTILGIIPATNTLGGYWPLFGANIVVYAIASVAGAYYGFALPRKAAMENDRLKRSGNIRAA